MILDLFLLHVSQAPSYCSFTSNLTMFWLIIAYWIGNGIYSAFIMIIINLIIYKSRLCYKITIKYWQTLSYSQLYWNKTQIKSSTKKNPHILRTPNFKKKCANYASKYGINMITGCNYVSLFGLYVSANYMTIIRSIRAKIYDMQQRFSWNPVGSHWVLHYSV